MNGAPRGSTLSPKTGEAEDLRQWVLAACDVFDVVDQECSAGVLLSKVADKAGTLLGLDLCVALAADATGDRLLVQGLPSLSAIVTDRLQFERVVLSDGAPGEAMNPYAQAYLTGRTVAISDVRDLPELQAWRRTTLQDGQIALIAAPIQDGDRVCGVVVGHCAHSRAFPDEDKDLFDLLAALVGTVLQTKRLRDESRAAVLELSTANAVLVRQRTGLEVADEQHCRLLRLMANDVGVLGVVDLLAELVDSSVTLEDPQGDTIACGARGVYVAPPRGKDRGLPAVAAAFEQVAEARVRCVEVEQPDGCVFAYWVAPVTLNNQVVARLWVGGRGLVLDETGRLGVERFALAVALELSKQKHAMQVRQRLSRDLMADLLSEVRPSEQSGLLERAAAMGHDLGTRHQVLVARPDATCEGTGSWQSLTEVADEVVRRQGGDALVGGGSGEVVLLLPEAAHASPGTLAGALLAEYRRRNPGRTASVVVGPTAADVMEIAAHYRAAQGALRLMLRRRHDAVLEIEQLGVASLLLTHGDPAALQQFANGVLGPLQERDAKRGGDLVPTLRTWLECECSGSRTAQRLIVHTNTVSYRLKSVEELLGRSLKSPALLVELKVALMVDDVFRESGPVGHGRPKEGAGPETTARTSAARRQSGA